jgi:hypothetical protein
VEGCGVNQGTCQVAGGTRNGSGNSSDGGYGDNQAAPLTLFQYTTGGSFVNSLVLPQAASGANFPVSGEYGSSSEGTLQLSGDGKYLTILGYGIGAPTFNANPGAYSDLTINPGNTALAQSGSVTGQSAYTPVPRVLSLIDANGNVNSSTAIYNIFNTNNPRSAFTVNGSTAYVSGQATGNDNDATGGVFYIPVGGVVTSPTPITGFDATNGSGQQVVAQDMRTVQIYNGTLYVSIDSKEGKNSAKDFIGTLGNPPATSLYGSGPGPTQLSNFGSSNTGKWTLATGTGNNVNAGAGITAINLSPVNYFFAAPNVLYVADSGNPMNDKNGDNNSNGTANIGDGGLQKWVNSNADGSGTWTLKYTLYQGLHLVNNGGASGATGLYGLTGIVSGGSATLYATNYNLSGLDPTFLYIITDTISNATPPGTSLPFTQLAAAPPDSNFKGVSFAPSIPNGGVEITSVPSGLRFTVRTFISTVTRFISSSAMEAIR